MQQQERCSGWVGNDGDFVCRDLDALPERVYSLSAFDSPEDVAQARQQEDAITFTKRDAQTLNF